MVRPLALPPLESRVPVRHAYPIMLDVTDRLVVIVGGGAVAVRKAAGVLEAGATRVRCVSPVFDPAIPPEVERIGETYEPRHLDGAGLVFAATDLPAVNDAVVRDARARGLLVTRADADDEEPADFTVPARLRRGGVTVAVSAGGSPALAAAVRDGLAARWDDRWTRMADVLAMVRPRLMSKVDPTLRRAVLRELATDEALDVLASRDVPGLLEWLVNKHPTLPKAAIHG